MPGRRPAQASEQSASTSARVGCVGSMRAVVAHSGLAAATVTAHWSALGRYQGDCAIRDTPRRSLGVIGSEGAVLASEVTDNATGSAPLGECISNAVRRWQFPAVSVEVTVNYPFDLSAVE